MSGLAGVPRAQNLPAMVRVRQNPAGPRLADPGAAVRDALEALDLQLLAGCKVAVAVGSRGIASLPLLVKETVEGLRRVGARPFVFPAMGSHGGATAPGQVEVLHHLGVTETSVGAPIRSTMEVEEITQALGQPVYLDRHAANADAIVVLNRVKPHTDFAGPLGSGVLKMLTIGISNHVGAAQRHRLMVRHGYQHTIRETARAVLATGRVVAGLGIVENGWDEVALVQAFAPAELIAGEESLLAQARAWMSRLPVEALDLLIVDEMGKEISGAGMDSNIIGRHSTYFEPQFTTPRITFVGVCDLTEASGGNAAGIGGADLMTALMHAKVDWDKTYTNSLTSGGTAGSRMPVVLPSTEDLVRIAVGCLGLDDDRDARVARIRNTLQLEELEVSTSVWQEISSRSDVEMGGVSTGLTFTSSGELCPW